MTFEAFRDELFAQAKAKGFADYELYYTAGDSFSVRVYQGEIAEYKNTATEGAGFRGTFGGKMGYAYTENLDSEIIPKLLENAAANAGIIEDEEVEKLYHGDDKYPDVVSYDPALNTVDTAQKIQWALDLEKYVLSLDPRVKMADYCTVSTGEGHMAMANSYGLNLSKKYNMGNAYVIARVEENGQNKSGYEYWAGRDFADFDYKKLAEKAVKEALASLGATSIPSGQYPVILDQNTTKDILGVFTSVFMAENCQKGFSLLNKSRLGETIAAPHITLRDDGVTDLSLGSMAFDAEGVATQNKAVIENGVLKTLLYNTKSAEKDGVKSTGNASKGGFGGAIGTSVTNFYLVPGTKSYDDLVAGLDKGVVITDMAGLHSGVNPVSGDFSVSADGYYVENGKIVKPVEQITVAGNFYDLLKNIETVGADLRFHSGGSGGIGAPSILVNGLSVAGE
ncbi:MAG: TldD/PmbA family protein [Defluviitaleaceae bacterium]|nr:TldD/PmbA family protein [Defluviitaleaceae bacterium]